jgi:hypothetical protein
MKVSEVRSLWKEMRENPVLLLATDLKAKEDLFNRFLNQQHSDSWCLIKTRGRQPLI